MDKEKILTIIKENREQAKKGRFRKREVQDRATKLFSQKYILSIVGVRRCGKSTLMKELIRIALKETDEQNILYLNLEHPFFNQYKGDVNNLQEIYSIFLSQANKRKKLYVFFDEIQFFEDWQVFVKHLYEKNEAKIVLTGSNSRLLSSELATLLSGRTLPIHVYPFSLHEAKVSFEQYLIQGGFPEVVLKHSTPELLAESYYKNIVYQDVIPRFNVQNTLAMENVSYYLVSNFGKELSYNTLKSISKLDDKTAKQYVAHLQDANLMYVINNFDFSLKKMIGNKKKVYLVDPLFAQLSFRHSPDTGRLFENFIYMMLRRTGASIFFHKNGVECDFLLKQGTKITTAIQVCYRLTQENQQREVEGLLDAMKKYNLKEGYIVTTSQQDQIKVGDKSIFIVDYTKLLTRIRN